MLFNKRKFVLLFGIVLLFAVTSICSYAVGTVYFSQEAGLYESGFSLELTTDLNGGTIYYTTDGSDPRASATAIAYSAPISILDGDSASLQKNDTELTYQVVDAFGSGYAPNGKTFRANVIRAYAKASRAQTDVFVRSYLVDESIFSRYADMPVVSLTVEPDSFAKNNPASSDYSKDEGIYITVMANPFGTKERITACFELIENDGTEVANQWVQLSMHGNGSLGNMQKSMRIYFDESAATGYMEDITLNKDNFKYDVFNGFSTNLNEEPIANFKRIVLRNSGNDAAETMIRDAYLARIMEPLHLDVQSWRPSVVFVNGEFWGMYNIRERFDNEYFEKYYGVLEENIVVIESPSPLVTGNNSSPYVISDGLEADLAAWEELYNYIKTKSMAYEPYFKTVSEQLDTDGFIDYIISQTFIHNNDWPGNNIKVWRNKNPEDPSGFDTKWRFVPMDMDHGFGYANCNQYNSNNLSTVYNNTNTICGTIFTRLMQNPTYKQKFINRYCEVLDTVLSSSTISPVWEEMVSSIKPVMREHFNRWPVDNTHTYSTWTNSVSVVRTYAQKRADNVYNHLVSTFGSSFVPAQTYLSKIESPTANQQTTGSTLDIKGWAVSLSETDGFYYIIDDGEPISVTGEPRSDITAEYGSIYNTSKATFSASVDISSLDYGAHTVTVYCVFPNGTDRVVGSTVTFTKKEPSEEFFCNLDYPKNNQTVSNGELTIQGWAIHGSTTDYFTYVIDNGAEIRIEGMDRPDITNIYGETYDTSRAGFVHTIDVSGLSEGNHTIAVYTYAQNGRRNLVEEIRTIIISTATDNTTVSVMESPTQGAQVSGILTIKGYALNQNGITGFSYSIDGSAETTVAGVRRTELRNQYGFTYGNSVYRSCGLSASVNISNLAPGTHVLRAWYTLTNGQRWLVGGAPITFTVPLTTYKHHVDNFYTNSHTAFLRGWAIASPVPFVRYDVVSSAGTFTLPIDQRPEVHTVFPGYATGNEGFNGFIDLSHVVPGTYTMDLRAYYNDNDYVLLETFSVERQQTPSFIYNIETPAENAVLSEAAVQFKGWVAHAEGVKELYYQIDGSERIALAPISRPDVANVDLPYYVYALKNGASFDKSGFDTTIDLTKYIKSNPLTMLSVKITGVSLAGTEFTVMESSYQCDAPYAKSIKVEKEALSENKLSLNGWFVHKKGVLAMYAQIDDGELLSPKTSYFDLSSANSVYNSFALANDNFANTGFSLETSTKALPNGTHTLYLYADLKDGTRFKFHEETFTKELYHTVTVAADTGVISPVSDTIGDGEDYKVSPVLKEGYVIDTLSITIDGSPYTLPESGIIPAADIIGNIVISIATRPYEENIAPALKNVVADVSGTQVDMYLYTDREAVDSFTLYAALYDSDGRMLRLIKTNADPIAKTPFTLNFTGITSAKKIQFFYLSDETFLSPIAPMSIKEL